MPRLQKSGLFRSMAGKTRTRYTKPSNAKKRAVVCNDSLTLCDKRADSVLAARKDKYHQNGRVGRGTGSPDAQRISVPRARPIATMSISGTSREPTCNQRLVIW